MPAFSEYSFSGPGLQDALMQAHLPALMPVLACLTGDLSAIRTEGDWEAWVTFFLEGVAAAAGDAERNIIEVASLLAADRKRLLQSPKAGPASYRLFEMLPMMPRFTIERVRQQLDTSFPTATAAVKVLEDLGIVAEMTGQKKNRSYSYQAYVELLSR